MLTVHHLGISQSERIVWLCEELGLEYKLVKHVRDPILAPDSLKSLPGNETGKSPFVEDTGESNDGSTPLVRLSESSAICEYIITKYGGDSGGGKKQQQQVRLALPPEDKHYADYLHWFHFGNGTLQMMMVCSMFIDLAGLDESNEAKAFADQRIYSALQNLDDRLATNKWLAGEAFTAAEIMNVYCLTTQRYFGPLISLAKYENVLRWLRDCSERPAYKAAMRKGDPDMKLLLEAAPPSQNMMAAGGTASNHWKK